MRLTEQIPFDPPTCHITDEMWNEILDYTPIQPAANPQFKAPYNASPSDLFEVASNRCSVPSYRFVRKNNDGQMLLFVDGACSNNGSPNARAGYAVCVGPNIVVRRRLEPAEDGSAAQTSNRAELRSAIVALGLRFWKGEGFNSLVIASDSEYMVKGYSQWYQKWKDNEWETKTGTKVLNKDLWEALDHQVHHLASKGVEVLFWWIPRELNEADKYAKQAVAQESPDLSF